MPSTGTPRLSPFPFVLSDLLTPGGGGGGGCLPLPEPLAAEQGWGHARSPKEPPCCGDSLVARKSCARGESPSLYPSQQFCETCRSAMTPGA